MAQEERNIGVVLMNMGGPTGTEAMQPFLYNLFKDEDIIKMGGGKIQELLARMVAKFRYPGVQEAYEEINGCPHGCKGNKHCINRKQNKVSSCCSPLNSLTEKQRQALEEHLRERLPGESVNVYSCMRYWTPLAETTIEDMLADGITHTVLVPLYPHFSWTTTGSNFRDWKSTCDEKFGGQLPWKEYHVKNYPLNPDYLDAINDRIDEALEELDPETRDKTHFIFSAHGTPKLEVRSGDPYTDEIRQTTEAIMERRGYDYEYWLSFQSRVGFQEWTQPNTAELVERHIEYGIKNFLMIPVAFVTDHVETLHELEIELVEDLEEEGYEFDSLKVTSGIDDHPSFVKALADEALSQLEHGTDLRADKTETNVA